MFYLDVFQQLEQKRVRYLLVGALAINLHGVPRLTMGLDLLLDFDDDNVRAFIAAAKTLLLTPPPPVFLNDLLDSKLRRAWVFQKGWTSLTLSPRDPRAPTVTVWINSPLNIDRALKTAEYLRVGELHVPVASIDDLIQFKGTVRHAEDLADVVHLHRLQQKGQKEKYG